MKRKYQEPNHTQTAILELKQPLRQAEDMIKKT
jgi:hypothetical protein